MIETDMILSADILHKLLKDFQFPKGFLLLRPVIVFNGFTMKHEIWYCYSDNLDERNMHCMAKPDYDVEFDSATKFEYVWDIDGIQVYPSPEPPTCMLITNEHGEPQYVDDSDNAICPTCHCLVMPNRGQGCCCERCNHDALIEFEHDYDEGLL